MKKTPQLDWNPVHKGDVYCSPACGMGCKRAQYNATVKAANAALKRMKTKGWTVRVHENLGWYWSLEHESGLLSVSGGQLPYRDNPAKNFHAMLSQSGSGGCDTLWYDQQQFDDPNTAVAHRLKLANVIVTKIAKVIKATTPK